MILAELAEAIDRLLAPAGDERGEWMRALALAFEVERFYTAVESLLARVLRALDGDVPSGSNWHLELLRAACVEVEGCRPAVVSRAVENDLRELLKFRHLTRHGYEREPQLVRMLEHAERVRRAHAALGESLDTLGRWLRA